MSDAKMYAVEVVEAGKSQPVVHIVAHRSAEDAVRWLHENTYASARVIHADVYLINGMAPIRVRSNKRIEYVTSSRSDDD